jgi:cytochrome P450
MGEIFALFPSNPHFQVCITTLSKKYDLPGLWYLDLWPLGPQQIIITDPDLALYMTVIKNHPKHPIEAVFIDPVVGANNIVATSGPKWKTIHNMLAPAFAIANIKNMVPMIAEEVMMFRSILHALADSGDVFSLDDTCSNLTFDIMGKVIFGQSFDAQTKGSAVLRNYNDICHAFSIERDAWNPITSRAQRRIRLAATKQLDGVLEKMILDRYKSIQQENIDVSKKRGLSIVDLVLRERIEEVRKSEGGSVSALGADFLAFALTQIKVLLLAGMYIIWPH